MTSHNAELAVLLRQAQWVLGDLAFEIGAGRASDRELRGVKKPWPFTSTKDQTSGHGGRGSAPTKSASPSRPLGELWSVRSTPGLWTFPVDVLVKTRLGPTGSPSR